MAGKKQPAKEPETTVKICNQCKKEAYAYVEVKTKRGSKIHICMNCWRGACNNGQNTTTVR